MGRDWLQEMTWGELRRCWTQGQGGEGAERGRGVLAAASGVGVILEMKTAGTGAALVDAVRASGFAGPVVYASFLHAEILGIRRMDAEARTMALMECVPVSGAAFAQDAEAQSVGLDYQFATGEFIAALHEAGLEVMLYTVNRSEMIERAIGLGADGVISDYPERVPKMRPFEEAMKSPLAGR